MIPLKQLTHPVVLLFVLLVSFVLLFSFSFSFNKKFYQFFFFLCLVSRFSSFSFFLSLFLLSCFPNSQFFFSLSFPHLGSNWLLDFLSLPKKKKFYSFQIVFFSFPFSSCPFFLFSSLLSFSLSFFLFFLVFSCLFFPFFLQLTFFYFRFSLFPGEQEVLLFPNCFLRVKQVVSKAVQSLFSVPDHFDVIEFDQIADPKQTTPISPLL